MSSLTASFPPDLTTGLHAIAALTREVYVLLADVLDRRAAAAGQEPRKLEGRAGALADQVQHLVETLPEASSPPAMRDHLQRLSRMLLTLRTALGVSQRAAMAAAWRTAKCYEGLARILRADPAVAPMLPELKPRNYLRNGFHIANGVLSATVYSLWDDRNLMMLIAISYTSWMLSMELARRFSPKINRWLVDVAFGWMARPAEAYKMNSATWYGIAITLMLLAQTPREACIAAVLTLGFGDPVAALIGKRFGKHKLVGNKTLEGALGFAAASILAVLAWAAMLQPPLLAAAASPGLAALQLAVVAGISGSAVELISKRIDDNFSIPLVVSLACAWIGLG